MESTEDHDYHMRKRVKCFSKNAVVARQNRQKKKEYFTSLEKKVSQLSSENVDLKQRLHKNDEKLEEVRLENKYLRSVLANRKEIEKLLRVVKIGSGLDVTSSLKLRSGMLSPVTSPTSFPRQIHVSDRKACRLHLPIDANQKSRCV